MKNQRKFSILPFKIFKHFSYNLTIQITDVIKVDTFVSDPYLRYNYIER